MATQLTLARQRGPTGPFRPVSDLRPPGHLHLASHLRKVDRLHSANHPRKVDRLHSIDCLRPISDLRPPDHLHLANHLREVDLLWPANHLRIAGCFRPVDYLRLNGCLRPIDYLRLNGCLRLACCQRQVGCFGQASWTGLRCSISRAGDRCLIGKSEVAGRLLTSLRHIPSDPDLTARHAPRWPHDSGLAVPDQRRNLLEDIMQTHRPALGRTTMRPAQLPSMPPCKTPMPMTRVLTAKLIRSRRIITSLRSVTHSGEFRVGE
ncbi:hypothetical protein [Actinoplanes sp. NPDC026619]|uniref:hypothetical protein n=1 Tax=Actinoplanes sp. NPDC026619 TaxID=3155798 RepID=UPI00340E1FA9